MSVTDGIYEFFQYWIYNLRNYFHIFLNLRPLTVAFIGLNSTFWCMFTKNRHSKKEISKKR